LKGWVIPKAVARVGLSLSRMEPTVPPVDNSVKPCRTIEQAHADLVEKFSRDPHPDLARMIASLELEIAEPSRGKRQAETKR
jgi:hypothetical protein